jgi:phosphopantetheinyl transferase (holo-ACP synthase)
MQSTNPNIKKYHYHYAAIFYSRDEASLKAAGDSIGKTVPATHKEIPLLDEAYRQKRAELRAAAAQEAESPTKAKEAAEKVGVDALNANGRHIL